MTQNQPDSRVNEEAIPSEQPIAASPGPAGERRKSQSGWRWLVGLVLFAILIAAAYLWSAPTPASDARDFTDKPLTAGREAKLARAMHRGEL